MKYFLSTICIILIVLIGIIYTNHVKVPETVFGSNPVGSDYNGTSTRSFNGTALNNLTVLKTSGGTLARVTITGANTGIMNFYDATTSDVTLRALATSSLLVVSIPASAAANDYDFDVEFRTGILYEIIGAAPTSTPVWR